MELVRSSQFRTLLLSLTLGCAPQGVTPSSTTPKPESIVDSEEEVTLCAEVRGKAGVVVTAAPVLEKACDMENEMHPVDWMYLLGSLRNEAAFRELAQYIHAPSDGVLRVIYPGSGSHIAPVMMAAELMDAGKITEAQFTFTEINPCTKDGLPNVLRDLNRIDPDFQLDEGGYFEQHEGEGVIQNYRILYKGQSIHIRFLFNMTGEAWYSEEDMAASDTMVIHDPANSPMASLELLLDYFESRLNNKIGPSQVLIEDFNEVRQSGRTFDLEMLGAVKRRGKEGNYYGHRYHQTRRFSGFSAAVACELEQRDMISAEDVVRGRENDNMEFYDRESDAMKAYNEAFEEVGKPFFSNGAVFEPHPEILGLEPNILKLLIDISFSGNTSGTRGNRVGEGFNKDGERLISERFYGEIFEHGEELISIIKTIDPKLAPVLALRIFQVLIKDEGHIVSYIKKNYPKDEASGYDKVTEFLEFLESCLEEKTKEEVKETLKAITRHVLGETEIKDGPEDVNFGKLMEEKEDHWSRLREVAKRLLEEI